MTTDQAMSELLERPPDEAPPALDDRRLYTNREVSWLDFNDRVLQLAEGEEVTLLERVKFLAIYCSNLDEFFMVRVAGWPDQGEAGTDYRGRDGMAQTSVTTRVHAPVMELGSA